MNAHVVRSEGIRADQVVRDVEARGPWSEADIAAAVVERIGEIVPSGRPAQSCGSSENWRTKDAQAGTEYEHQQRRCYEAPRGKHSLTSTDAYPMGMRLHVTATQPPKSPRVTKNCGAFPMRGLRKYERARGLIYSPVSALYCAFVSGTTDSRPIFTSGESANSLLALICSSDTGLARALPTLIFTTGFLGSAASTDTTVAVPTATLRPPVS